MIQLQIAIINSEQDPASLAKLHLSLHAQDEALTKKLYVIVIHFNSSDFLCHTPDEGVLHRQFLLWILILISSPQRH
jgi:hypothetical protein